MIIEFSVTNFRSIKEEQVFSFVAEASKSKPDNVFEAKIRQGVSLKEFLKGEEKGEEKSTFETIRLLKAAVIYGANASGKSNVLKAFETLIELLQTVQEINKPIKNYNPFLFDKISKTKLTSFKLTFIGVFDYKYEYFIEYNKEQIITEKFDYYPFGQIRNLFTRTLDNQNEIGHEVKLSNDLDSRVLNIHKNQPLLHKLISEPSKFYYSLYKYFNQDFNFFAVNMFKLDQWQQQVNNRIQKKQNDLEKKRLEKLLQLADIKLESFELTKDSDNNLAWIYEVDTAYKLSGIHAIYNNNILTTEKQKLSFSHQSRGTNILYSLGGKILEQLDKGGTMFIDEINTSLHPRLAKFLVLLFQHPKSNPKNAQLIFTTHETTFLDKNLFRREQIWFTEKDEFGVTELYSMQDFDKVREDTPFEKWYLAGKFGGLPDIKELEFIFGDGEN